MFSRYLKTRTAVFFRRQFNGATLYDAIEIAAQNERRHLFTGYQELCKLPVDVGSIARRKGISIVKDKSGALKVDGVLQPAKKGYTLYVSRNTTIARMRTTIAHEIGHLLFKDGRRHKIGVLSRVEREAEDYVCERFGAALLMPLGMVQRYIGRMPQNNAWDMLMYLEFVARKFKVSLPALIVRAGMVKNLHRLSLILLCLEHFANRFTRKDSKLRVKICSSLGTLKHMRTWYNRSVEGLNLTSALTLFNAWTKYVNNRVEPTGGRYVILKDEQLVRASPKSLSWVTEKILLSLVKDRKWYKKRLTMQVVSCLYVRKGWNKKRAYIISIIKPPKNE